MTNTSPEARDVIAQAILFGAQSAEMWQFIEEAARENFRVKADAIIAALAAEGKVIEDDWRPIDSAPKDGTAILVCRTSHPFSHQVVHWDDEEREWRIGRHSRYSTERPPTHWRHLAEPPTPTLPPAGDER